MAIDKQNRGEGNQQDEETMRRTESGPEGGGNESLKRQHVSSEVGDRKLGMHRSGEERESRWQELGRGS